MDLYNFLPKYQIINYPLNIYDNNLQKVLYNKKEFYDERLDKFEKKPSQKGELMKHQKIISRFLSSYTPYDGILLFHYMGTGKTCSVIGSIEKIFNEKQYNLQKAIIIVKGKNIINNFINEIINTCTNDIYVPVDDNFKYLSKDIQYNRIKKEIRKRYTFYTYYTFSKMIKNISNENIKQNFSNHIIAIDEVHNIRNKHEKKQDVNIYKEIHRFLHNINNKKVILMSGTPMKDRVEEIADVFNLILPITKQLPTSNNFLSTYFYKNKDTYELNSAMISLLQSNIKGYISYLKINLKNVNKIYNGLPIYNLNFFKVYPDYMASFQNEIYLKIFEKENSNSTSTNDNELKNYKSWYSNSRQASLAVYPDGTTGKSGFEKYMKKIQKKKINKYNLTLEFKKMFKNKNNEEKLDILKKYSSKYAVIIKDIIENRDKCTLVYSSFVKGSGLILLAELLKLFNYKETTTRNYSQKPSFIILSNETNTTETMSKLLKLFNKPNNIHGEYIQVILGSRVISEGLSISHIQKVHIATGHWNYSETDQAIARSFREFSHTYLYEKEKKDIDVNIYLHVSIPNIEKDNGENELDYSQSIDLLLYKKSEVKDISIKNMEKFLKVNAVDCLLNYNRNKYSGIDYSRDCEYDICDIKCEASLTDNDPIIDNSTYNIYYSDDIEYEIKNYIKNIFKNIFAISYIRLKKEIKELFPNQNIEFQLFSSLKYLIDNSIPIYNKYGFVNYIRYQYNTYFLIGNLSQQYNILSYYYTEKPILLLKKKFTYIVNDYYNNHFVDVIISQLIESKNKELLFTIPTQLLSITLEIFLIAKMKNTTKNVDFRNWFLNFFDKYIHYINYDNSKILVSSFLYTTKNILRCYINDKWLNCENDMIEIFKEMIVKQSKHIIKKSKYHALYDSKNKFIIRDVSKDELKTNEDNRKNTTGRVCNTWDKKDLIWLCYYFNIPLQLSNRKKMNSILSKLNKFETDDDLYDHMMDDNFKKTKDLNHLIDSYEDDFDFEELSFKQLKIIYFFLFASKKLICTELEKYFKDNDLIVINEKK